MLLGDLEYNGTVAEKILALNPTAPLVRLLMSRYLVSAFKHWCMFETQYKELFVDDPLSYYEVTRNILSFVAFYLNLYNSPNFGVVSGDQRTVTYGWVLGDVSELVYGLHVTVPAKRSSFVDPRNLEITIRDIDHIGPDGEIPLLSEMTLLYLPPKYIHEALFALLRKLRQESRQSLKSSRTWRKYAKYCKRKRL